MGVMRVARIGFTPVKGGRHVTHSSVELTHTGPVGDRAFCLVDPTVDRCLRTAEHPDLLRSRAAWHQGTLSVDLPSGRVTGQPVPTGEARTVDYWGRSTQVEVVEGPWASAYSAHVGLDVVLALSAPGAVVYGGSVTLITTASLARLSDDLGQPLDAARFRATFELEGGAAAPGAEEAWIGRRVRLGTAEVRVRGPVPRCAVVDLHPDTGVRDVRVLQALAAYSRDGRDVTFGVDADVVVPGVLTTGDAASLV